MSCASSSTDDLEKLRLVLHYRLHAAYDLIERWAEVTNLGEAATTLERVFTAQWHLPPRRSYRLSHLYGRWADEWHIGREPLAVGKKILESRRITTSHHGQPWFAVDGGGADEEQGEVWFGALAWSGNWKFIAERTEVRRHAAQPGAERLGLCLAAQSGGKLRHPAGYLRLYPARIWRGQPPAARLHP